jgi:hypothetical protein
MTMMRRSPGPKMIVCQTLFFVATQLGCVEGFTSIAGILPKARSSLPIVESQRQSTSTTDDWESSSSSSSYGTPSAWSIGDDWDDLSSENPVNAVPDSGTLFNQDLSRTAAREMAAAASALDAKVEKSEEDIWLTDVIDEIHNEFSTMEASTKLYDTGFESYTKTVHFLDEMGKEIAMLVRCNQSPEELLVEEGRALPSLSQTEKNHVSQLVEVAATNENGDLVFQPTKFLKESISIIFQQHATRAESDDNKKNGDDSEKESNLGPLRMDRTAIANWMTQCLRTEKTFKKVSSHDKRVVQTIAHHSTYGTGHLTEPEFLQFYLHTIVGDTQPSVESKASRDVLFQQFQYRQDLVDAVFRDVRNHGILPPLEQERAKKADELRQTYGSATAQESQAKADQITGMDGIDSLLDECEILDWDHRVEQSQKISSGKSQRGQAMGSKSSHKLLEMASDGKTPLYVRDGKHGTFQRFPHPLNWPCLFAPCTCASATISVNFFHVCRFQCSLTKSHVLGACRYVL